MPVFLAHGTLGAFDELVFIGVAAIFLITMGISWVRSRMTQPKLDPPETSDTSDAAASDSPGRFKLD